MDAAFRRTGRGFAVLTWRRHAASSLNRSSLRSRRSRCVCAAALVTAAIAASAGRAPSSLRHSREKRARGHLTEISSLARHRRCRSPLCPRQRQAEESELAEEWVSSGGRFRLDSASARGISIGVRISCCIHASAEGPTYLTRPPTCHLRQYSQVPRSVQESPARPMPRCRLPHHIPPPGPRQRNGVVRRAVDQPPAWEFGANTALTSTATWRLIQLHSGSNWAAHSTTR